MWLVDADKGMVRATTDSALLPPFHPPPRDAADDRTARFTGGMAYDADIEGVYSESSYVLLDTASPDTTKLWRFLLLSRRYVLLNTSAARLARTSPASRCRTAPTPSSCRTRAHGVCCV